MIDIKEGFEIPGTALIGQPTPSSPTPQPSERHQKFEDEGA